MNNEEFWKNYSLGTELEVSGVFIYNGLEPLNEIDNFNYEEDVFEILYNLSVGIERLLKIAVILIEEIDFNNKEVKIEFEESLKTHNTISLLSRIENKHTLHLNNYQKSFLHLLSDFYKKNRYDRYIINLNNNYNKDKDSFLEFICRALNLKRGEYDNFFNPLSNTNQTKRFISKIVEKFTISIYDIIKLEASKLNISTYELRPNGKAYRIFIYKDFYSTYSDVLRKELLIRLINNCDSGFIKFIRKIEALPFDIQDENEIFRAIINSRKEQQYFDELDHFYEQLDNKKERFEILEVLGKTGIDFSENDNK